MLELSALPSIFNMILADKQEHGSTWRVCWQKERQDQKGVIIVVLAPAEGKTRLERFNYSCTSPAGPTPHKTQYILWSSV